MAADSEIKVMGAAAVIRSASGSDVYLYQGAVVLAREFDEDSVKHCIAVGLVERVKAAPKVDPAADAAAVKAKADAAAAAEKAKADASAAAVKAAAK